MAVNCCCWTLRVKRENIADVLRFLTKQKLVAKQYKILPLNESKSEYYLPIVRKLTATELNQLGVEDQQLSTNLERRAFDPEQTPYKQIRAQLANYLPSTAIDDLPSKWEKIGDVVILPRLTSELEPYSKIIGKVYAEVLNAVTTCENIGKIQGVTRRPQLKVIYGSKTETIHIENKIRYKLDVLKQMFSSGNIDERKRMAELNCHNEIIVDMFAGIGYFTLPLAKYSAPAKVYACELEPETYQYLVTNIKLNSVESKVIALFGDNREVAPTDIADRVLLDYLHDTHKYLPTAFRTLNRNKSCVIHYHEVCPRELLPERPLTRVKTVAENLGWTVVKSTFRIVKSYAPAVYHIVLDVYVVSRE